jgi:hypothetical protein
MGFAFMSTKIQVKIRIYVLKFDYFARPIAKKKL